MIPAKLYEEDGRVYVEVHDTDRARLALMVAHGGAGLLTREETRAETVTPNRHARDLFPQTPLGHK